MLSLLAALLTATQSETAAGVDGAVADPLHRVVAIEIGPADLVLEGKRPSKRVEHTVHFSGTLCVWTKSEDVDPFLRVEDASAAVLKEDDDGGGKPAPCIVLEVEPGEVLSVVVALKDALDLPRSLELHFVGAPESETTRAAAAKGREVLHQAQDLQAAGDNDRARDLLAQALEDLLAVDDAGQSAAIASVLWALGYPAWELNALPTAKRAWGKAADHRERMLPADHPDVLWARTNRAITIGKMGDLPGARALYSQVLEARERTHPADHPDLLAARVNLASTTYAMGDFKSTRALEEQVLETRERTLPADHPNLLVARGRLAVTMKRMGDLEGARALQRQVTEAYERTLPEDHPDLLDARGNLAITMYTMGDLKSARALEEQVLRARERTLPEDHPDLLVARRSLAITMKEMGDLKSARALEEQVLRARERTLPEDHTDILAARVTLANTMSEMGDLPGARALEEQVLEARERTLPEDHPALLDARRNLAVTMSETGDLPGARALEEQVLEARERTLPEDHSDLLDARANLASALYSMGDLKGALALEEQVLEACVRTLPEDHADVLAAQMNLAITLGDMGDLPAARALEERVLATRERTLAKDHPDVVSAQRNLAVVMHSMGDLPGARALQSKVIEAYERTLPENHPDLLDVRGSVALTLYSMGDLPASRALLPKIVSGMLRRAVSALALSTREAREAVGGNADCLGLALFMSDPTDPEARAGIFELVETRRLVAADAAATLSAASSDSELAPLVFAAAEARRSINDLVAGASSEAKSGDELRAELEALSAKRDRAERTIARALAEQGLVADAIESEKLSAALPAGTAAIGFLRHEGRRLDGATHRVERDEDRLLAHVLCARGTLARVDLGPAEDLEELVGAWRAAIGSSVAARGVGVQAHVPEPGADVELGARLRERLLDPIVRAANESATTLFICPDDLVFLVPLDALPQGGGIVGDRLRIVVLSSFGSVIQPPAQTQSAPGLLALGGVAYGADVAAAALPLLASTGAPIETSLRGGGNEFAALSGTLEETKTLFGLFTRAFDRDAVLLTGNRATKAALAEKVEGTRYLHLATHGWFAPESVKSVLDEPAERGGWQRMSVEETVTGFAPMTLCGLALAGANKGRDSLGRVPGILTAEELCSLDLSQCELAVLSACETNVGIRRAGQGIQSLQAALHAAGARTAITSLWKVDDEATRKLMERFYTYLWIEKLPKSDALWRAKMDLRAAGHPVRDWAAWVLSGASD